MFVVNLKSFRGDDSGIFECNVWRSPGEMEEKGKRAKISCEMQTMYILKKTLYC